MLSKSSLRYELWFGEELMFLFMPNWGVPVPKDRLKRNFDVH